MDKVSPYGLRDSAGIIQVIGRPRNPQVRPIHAFGGVTNETLDNVQAPKLGEGYKRYPEEQQEGL